MKRILVLALAQLMLLTPLASSAAEAQAPSQEPAKPDTALTAPADTSSYSVGFRAGQVTASQCHPTWGWILGGYLSSGLLVIGPGIVAVVSQTGHPAPPPVVVSSIADRDGQYQCGFMKGYESRAKSKALGRTLLGAALGTALLAVAIASSGGLELDFSGGWDGKLDTHSK